MKTVYDKNNKAIGVQMGNVFIKAIPQSTMVYEEHSAIIECQKGNLEAFGSLYDLHVKKIYNFLYYRVYDRDLAEDLTSIAFTKAIENIKKFNPEKGQFSSWLYKIAQNSLIDNARTTKKSVSIDEGFDKSDEDRSLESSIDSKERLKKVQKYLETLSEEHQEIVKLRVWDGLSYKEIAEITGKTEGSAKVMFSRVIAKIQKEMPLLIVLMVAINIIKHKA